MDRIDDNKILGTLCNRGHDHNSTGKSLRYKCGHGACVECTTINARKNREANPERYNKIKAEYREKNREAARVYQKNNYASNAEKIKAQNRGYYQNNSKKIGDRIKLYRQNEGKDVIRAYAKKYRREHRQNKTTSAISCNLRNLVNQAFRLYSQTGKMMVSSKYGIDYKAIIEHLGPHPNTRGIKGDFHIDHIIPVSAFDLTDLEQIKIAFAPSNHRWLLAHENRSKNANLPSLDIVPVELLAMLDNHNLGIMANG